MGATTERDLGLCLVRVQTKREVWSYTVALQEPAGNIWTYGWGNRLSKPLSAVWTNHTFDGSSALSGSWSSIGLDWASQAYHPNRPIVVNKGFPTFSHNTAFKSEGSQGNSTCSQKTFVRLEKNTEHRGDSPSSSPSWLPRPPWRKDEFMFWYIGCVVGFVLLDSVDKELLPELFLNVML